MTTILAPTWWLHKGWEGGGFAGGWPIGPLPTCCVNLTEDLLTLSFCWSPRHLDVRRTRRGGRSESSIELIDTAGEESSYHIDIVKRCKN
jgi:hypothetical protein